MGFLDRLFKRSNNLIADPNFQASVQFMTPGQPVYTPKNYVSFVKEGYRKNPTVYACINKISSAAAGINWKLYKDKSELHEIENHALLDLWNKPNPTQYGSGPLVEAIFGFWLMSGNSYLWAFRPNPKEPPLALWPLRPDRVKAVVGSVGIDSYVYGYGSESVQEYDRADIMHLKFPAYDDDVYGLSPVETASYYVDQINESMGWNTALMQNAGRPASVFMSKNYLTTEQRNQIRDEIRRRYSGKRNAGMPLILEADMQWQNMSLKPAELDWLESRERNTRDIAAVFDIAPELIGDAAGKTFANVSEARQALYIENVLPKMDRFRDYINSWLVPMYPDLAGGAYFTYDTKDIEALAALFQAAEDSKQARARENWQAGGITLNEFREAIGADPVDKGGDSLLIPNTATLVSLESLEDYSDQTPEPVPPALAGDPTQANPQALPPPKDQAEPGKDEQGKINEEVLRLLIKAFAEYRNEKSNKYHEVYSTAIDSPPPNLQLRPLPIQAEDGSARAEVPARSEGKANRIEPLSSQMSATPFINAYLSNDTDGGDKAQKSSYKSFIKRFD